MTSSASSIVKLIAATAALWLLAAVPAWLLAGPAGVEGLTYALLLCLAPGVAAMLFVNPKSGRGDALTGLVVGMGLRMTAVLAGALWLQHARPDLGLKEFHIWLIVGYLVALAIETRMLLGQAADVRSGPKAV